jgi:hypothetical protein
VVYVEFAVALVDHVALDRLGRPSLRMAVQAFVAGVDDKVEILDQPFGLHGEVIRV